MTNQTKLSPTLAALLSDAGPNDRQDAIVIYRSEPQEDWRVRGRLRDLKTRLAEVEARASAQEAVQSRVIEAYRRESLRRVTKPEPLAARGLGGKVLPVAKVEVTRKTLDALLEQSDVVAVMPNQRVSLIGPKKVDYQNLATQERKDGLTWGLKQLEIPEIWSVTRGANINVAVMDTGVHGDHPALAGRVRGFVILDPLGRRITASPSFDGDEHGTHVCGTIAGGKTSDGVAIGVAPEASLLVAGVLVGRGTLAALIEGLAWAIEQGADVINMSLGFAYYEPLFTQVLDLILENGTLPVVAIGNESHGNTSSPGSAHNALSVGAAEKQTGGKLAVAPFSSGASLSFPGQDPALVIKPDLVGPGAQVYSVIPPKKIRDGGAFEYN
ncbi:MAG: peptidase S8 and S53 subtilisin kexin sedolisin [Sphingobacteriia bacterium]|nr:peptidase S8 and S53 subtilisin kexin sedolisin [Sphingobacteriia bacterium]